MSDPGSTPPPPGSGDGGYAAAPPPAPGSAPPPANPYQAAPPVAQPQVPAAGPVVRPKSMDLAVTLMRAGAALSLLSVLTVFLTLDELRATVEDGIEDSGEVPTDTLVNAGVAFGIGVAVIVGLIGVGLWLWMASVNGKGRSWARIVASVFFGLSVLGFVANLVQAQPALSRVLGIASFLLGLVVIVLLWRKESSEFYARSSAPRY